MGGVRGGDPLDEGGDVRVGPVEDRGGASGAGYFDAVARTAVDWDGHAAASCDGGPGAVRDLSDHLRLDLATSPPATNSSPATAGPCASRTA
ncbi:hypothetical protein [Streptomyces mirabilis]|uniref:hypothetical protein n=1 Tax=Streptomyces mirabilis TaxID=68239 RepID=UPI0007660A87